MVKLMVKYKHCSLCGCSVANTPVRKQMRQQHASQGLASAGQTIPYYAPCGPGQHIINQSSMLLVKSESTELLIRQITYLRDLTNLRHTNGDKSLCASHHRTLIPQAENAV